MCRKKFRIFIAITSIVLVGLLANGYVQANDKGLKRTKRERFDEDRSYDAAELYGKEGQMEEAFHKDVRQYQKESLELLKEIRDLLKEQNESIVSE